jgi:hypothetical protein
VLQRNLLAREAARRGISLSDRERAAVREKQVTGWRGEDNFRTALAMLDVTEAYLLRRMEMNQLARKMAEIDVEKQPAPTEAEIHAFYKDNPARYLGPSTALRYLLLPAGWSRKQVAQVSGESATLRQEGKNYESLVRRFSIHASAATGGVVAEGQGGAWPHPDLAQGLKPGRLSRDLADEAGIHLYARDIQIPLPLESVRARVAADLREARVAAGLRSTAERLRKASVVEFLDGEAPASVTAPHGGRH